MRLRPAAAVSAAVLSVALLAGCSAGAGEDPTPSGTAEGAQNLCDLVAAPGAASDAVTVSGEVGESSSVAFDAPLEVPELQVSVVAEGSGQELTADDLVQVAFSSFDAETGEELINVGYEPGQIFPERVNADSGLGQILGCASPGERVVVTFPGTEEYNAEVYVIDVMSTVPAAAWGAEQDAVDGMPTVVLDESGAPAITIPDADAPAEVQLATLKEGEGDVVQPGDYVLVQYTGVRWSTGEEFDSTWTRGGEPTTFATTQVVDGFRQALEGYPVGSQVLVVVPPAAGYGEGEINEEDLVGETLVFVVDIIGAVRGQG